MILGDLAEDALVGARRERGEGRGGLENLFIPPTHPGETPSSNEIGRTATKRDWPRGSRSVGRSVLGGGSGANGVRGKGRGSSSLFREGRERCSKKDGGNGEGGLKEGDNL